MAMDSKRLPSHSYRLLLVLYGASAVALVPFGLLYAYAVENGRTQPVVFWACLGIGILAALIVWANLESRLSHRSPSLSSPQRNITMNYYYVVTMNFDSAASLPPFAQISTSPEQANTTSAVATQIESVIVMPLAA
jgi:hypothetical protein